MFQTQLLLILILVPASSTKANVPDACRLPVFHHPTRPTGESTFCKSRDFQGNFDVFVAMITFPPNTLTKENLMEAFEPESAFQPECLELLLGFWMVRSTDRNSNPVLILESTCGPRVIIRLELRPFTKSVSSNGTFSYSGGRLPVESFRSVLYYVQIDGIFSPIFYTDFDKNVQKSNGTLVHVISHLHLPFEIPVSSSKSLRYDRSAAAGCKCDRVRASFGRPSSLSRETSVGVQLFMGIAGTAAGLVIVTVAVAVVISKRSTRTASVGPLQPDIPVTSSKE